MCASSLLVWSCKHPADRSPGGLKINYKYDKIMQNNHTNKFGNIFFNLLVERGTIGNVLEVETNMPGILKESSANFVEILLGTPYKRSFDRLKQTKNN